MQVFILIFSLCSSFKKNSWKSWPISPWIFLHISTKFTVQLFDHEQNDVATSDFKKILSTLSFIQQVVIWIDYTKNNQSCKQIVNIDLTQVSRLGVYLYVEKCSCYCLSISLWYWFCSFFTNYFKFEMILKSFNNVVSLSMCFPKNEKICNAIFAYGFTFHKLGLMH